ncbi:uncharacterized protein LOC131210902 isoform X2 [Anopheles bellator]|uniref:uncharacterized protein LOC131210902 isoform X2 n=1 Tax=Anopheles bellator TaxID=139047 RepID=UPI00264A42BE|nr:uncharacterized protein LOC131210902 isoform X2 [Anopheles bellator]
MASAFPSWSLVLVVTAIVGLRLDSAAAAPMYRSGAREAVQGCGRSTQAELVECVAASVQQFVNFMSSGKLTPKHWITPFDPLHLPNMTIYQRKEMRAKAVYVNRYLVGLKNSFIQDVRVDLDRLQFNATALLPALEILGMFASAVGQESDLATENSILTFSLRNTVIDFVARGSLYTPEGSSSPHLWLQLDINYMAIASYVLSEHLGTDHGTSATAAITPAKFMKLMEKDLRVQLIRRLQYIANEALALAPFDQLFPV